MVSISSQAKKMILAFVLAAWPAVAQANIGDDLTQLRARYGSVTYMGPQLLFEVRLYNNQILPAAGSANPEDHLSVAVYFDGDHSAMEVFTRNTSDPEKSDLSSKDIDTILAAASEGQTWDSIESKTGKPTWLRSDKKLIARFSSNTSGDASGASVLVVMVNSNK
jgi:hypothetical protein